MIAFRQTRDFDLENFSSNRSDRSFPSNMTTNNGPVQSVGPKSFRRIRVRRGERAAPTTERWRDWEQMARGAASARRTSRSPIAFPIFPRRTRPGLTAARDTAPPIVSSRSRASLVRKPAALLAAGTQMSEAKEGKE